MTSAERIKTYQTIEQLRGNPLIVYATSTRPNVAAFMAADAVREFIDQLDKIDGSKTAVDVLIHSGGGDPLAAWKLMSVLRERFSKVNVLVPYMAFSAATLFSLGADEIVMHPHASLGPIDPQITVRRKDGDDVQFSYEDVGAFLRFVKTEVGLTDQSQVSAVVDRLLSTIDPLKVGFAQRASELSTDVGERLLSVHMRDDKAGKETPRQIAEQLNKSFFAHGDAVSRGRARSLGLKIAEPNSELEQAIWAAYLEVERLMELRNAFNALELFLADANAAASFAPPAPLVLPANTPPQYVESAWNAALGQAIQAAQAGRAPVVTFNNIVAIVESLQLQRRFRQTGEISGVRRGQDVQIGVTGTWSGWEDCPAV